MRSDAAMRVCPACGDLLHGHWTCKICRCFGHKNIQCRNDSAICQPCDTSLFRSGKRRCKGCGKVKLITKFARYPTGTYRRVCHACRSRADRHGYPTERRLARNARRHATWAATRRDWRKENPEKAREGYRAFHQKHKAKRNAQSTAWRVKNRERHAAYCRAWRVRNREKDRLARRARYQKRKLALFWGRQG